MRDWCWSGVNLLKMSTDVRKNMMEVLWNMFVLVEVKCICIGINEILKGFCNTY